MDRLAWCKEQPRGARLTKPKQTLARAHFAEADETLQNMVIAKGKWRTIMAYYACYHALTVLLAACGIRCEIHDCALALMELFEFTPTDKALLVRLKEDRIQAQYYLQPREPPDERAVIAFIERCKILNERLRVGEIAAIRERIKQA
jgi:hypothetical protein